MELTATHPIVEPAPGRAGARLLVIVIAAVSMNLAAALLIEQAASRADRVPIVIGVLLVMAIVVNAARFLLWRAAHRRYRFADVMPLTALFFPLVGFVSWLKGEPMNWRSVGGILLITAGAWTLARRVDDDVA